MRSSRLIGAAFATLASLIFTNAYPAEMTSAQVKQADALAQALEKSCLDNAALKGAPDALTRAMGQWISSPEVCGCEVRNLRQVLTPAVLAMKQEEQKDFFVHFSLTKGAECIVPAIKTNLSASCEGVFGSILQSVPAEDLKKKLQSHGFANADAFLARTCGCFRHSLSEITTEAWVDSSVSAYNAYLERKRTGDQSIQAPASPFDGIASKCVVPLTSPSNTPAAKPTQGEAGRAVVMHDVPAGWEIKPLTERQANEGIVLSLHSQALGASLIMSTPKRRDGADSAGFAAARRSALAGKVQNPRLSDITSLKINGKAAWRFEVAGSIEGYAVTYLATVAENADSMNMVLAWTSQAKYEAQRDALTRTSDNIAAPPR